LRIDPVIFLSVPLTRISLTGNRKPYNTQER
jgi:hypothetical protein